MLRFLPLAVLLAGSMFLSGCALTSTASPGEERGLSLQGKLMGGQQPIKGAHVHLFAASNGEIAGPNIAPSAANASIPLLNTAATDSSGPYVLTGGDGSFNIGGDYTCSPDQQVYLYATGGDSGYKGNSAIGGLAILGACPASGDFSSTTPYLTINEISTAVAAYAFSGYASDATHVSSSGTALAKIGIANAFATAGNLVSLTYGQAFTTTPAGNGSVPNAELNTLGDILAACVNSGDSVNDGVSTHSVNCTTLLSNALFAGTTGVTPVDTASAAINIAHNPTANVHNLYQLASSNPPFAAGLTAEPSDFSLAVTYAGHGLAGGSAIAVDGSGNVWVAGSQVFTGFSLSSSKLSPLGVPLFNSTAYTQFPDELAIDANNNAWLGTQAAQIYKYLPTAQLITGFPVVPVDGNANVIVSDTSGNLWVGTNNGVGNRIVELTPSGTQAPGSPWTASGIPAGGIIDQAGDFWVNLDESSIDEYVLSSASPGSLTGSSFAAAGADYLTVDHSGDILGTNGSNISRYTRAHSLDKSVDISGTSTVSGIAVDGAGTVWAAHFGDYPGFTFPGQTYHAPYFDILSSGLSKTGSISNPTLSTTSRGGPLAFDGSGNLWTVDSMKNCVIEFIGIGTPVVTPMVANYIAPYSAAASRP